MKALSYPEWNRLDLVDLPKPMPAENEVLVRVAACGICGSELESFRTQSPRRMPPLIMGHEFCGEVESVGIAVSAEFVGKRVIAHSVIHCGSCSACNRGETNLCSSRQLFGMHRPGAFAEFIAAPSKILLPWPATLSPAAAALAEPLANGINAIRQADASRLDRVLIIGAGPIGLMCTVAASQLHRTDIMVTDPVPERREAAKLLGARRVVDPSRTDFVQELSEYWSKKASHVIDAVGSAATKALSIDLVEPGGTVVWLGLRDNEIRLDSYSMILRQIRVTGAYAGSMDDLQTAIHVLASGNIDLSWITTYSLRNGAVGFREMLKGTGANIKGVLKIT